MPMYVFQCQTCGEWDEEVREIVDRDNPCLCGTCKAPMKRVPTVAQFGKAHQFRLFSSKGDTMALGKKRSS